MKFKKNLMILSSVLFLSGCLSSNTTAPETQNKGFGDAVTVGNFQFILNGAYNTKKVGGDYLNDTTQNNFVVLNVTVKNIGSSEETLYTSMMTFHQNDSEYEPHSSGIYLDDGFYVLQSIGSKIIKNLNVVYETASEWSDKDYLEVRSSSYSYKSENIYLSGTAQIKHTHKYNNEYEHDETDHWQVCTECAEPGEKAHHSFSLRTVEPTFEEVGHKIYTCSVCGYSYTEDFGEKVPHNYYSTYSYDSENHWYACSDVGYSSLKDGVEQHEFSESIIEPTFEAQGYTLHECSKCDYSYKDNYTAQLVHSFSDVWSFDENKHWHYCTDSGYETLKGSETSHSFDDWWTVTEATDNTDGLERRDCTICDYYETNVIESNIVRSKKELVFKLDTDNTYSVTGINSSSNLKRVFIPDEYENRPVRTISANAFKNNQTIEAVIFGANVTYIGKDAFSNCSNLSSLSLNEGLLSIYLSAFSNCSSLEEVIMPSSINQISNDAFNGCTSLSFNENNNGLYLGNSDNPFVVLMALSSNVSTFTVNDNCKLIYDNVFKNNTYLKVLSIPQSVKALASDVFYGCYNIESLTVPFVGPRLYTQSGESMDSIGTYFPSFFGKTEFENSYVTLSNASGKWYLPLSLKQVTILNDNIYRECFLGCSSIKELNFNSTSEEIGENAFQACYQLQRFVVPDSIKTIKSGSFMNCQCLNTIVIGSSVTSIQGVAFINCYKLVEVVNKSSLIFTKGDNSYGYISYYAKHITDSLDKIRVSEDSSGIVSFLDGENKWIMDYNGNENEITLPNGTYGMYTWALRQAIGVRKLTTNSELKYVQSLCMPANLETLVWNAVACENQTESPLTQLAKLKKIEISDEVTVLPEFVFGGASNVNSLVLPTSVSEIRKNAFSGWGSLNGVFYCGNETEWSCISVVGTGNNAFISANVYYYSEEEPLIDGVYWHYVNGTPTIWYI